MPFEFTDEASVADECDAHVVHLPAKISSKGELLQELYEHLQLPGYFGFNWDALSDCLRDFYWISSSTIMIVHADLPQLPADERRAYLKILAEAVESWQQEDDHHFRVLFPAAAYADVAACFTSASD